MTSAKDDLIAGLEDAIAYAKGDKSRATERVVNVPQTSVKRPFEVNERILRSEGWYQDDRGYWFLEGTHINGTLDLMGAWKLRQILKEWGDE